MVEKYMKVALKEAEKSYFLNEVPVGAVIVKNNKIISKAHNQKNKYKIPTKHAEIIAIEKACKKLKSWQLDECEMYVTLEPCLMCIGAIIESRISKVFFSTKSEKYGFSKFINYKNHIKKILITEENFLKKESQMLLKNFFENKRK